MAFLRYLNDNFKKFDLFLFIPTAIATFMGLLLITSATHSTGSIKLPIIQFCAAFIGVCVAFIIILIDYDNMSQFSKYIYVLCIMMLIATLIFGKEVYGNKNWISLGPINIQPSEFVKIGFIITFATHLKNVGEDINQFKNILFLGVHFAVIFAFVLMQGDMGSALVFFFIFLGMLFAAGLNVYYFLGGIGTVIITSPYIFKYLLKDYQRKRILSVYDTSIDPLGYGYQTLQSKITIGSGGLFGKGLFKGVQTQYGILPAKQTDFIFSVAGEELGFFGLFIIIFILSFIIIRCFYVAKKAPDRLGCYMCAGVGSMFMFQVIENIGMCIGVLPVIGITLPFYSYGGSSILSSMIAVGIVMSVNSKRRHGVFF